MPKLSIAACLQGFIVNSFIIVTLASLTPAFAATDDDNAKKIVETADRVRFPAEGFQVDINITSQAPDQAAELRKYRVLTKGNDNTIVMTMEPAADRGQILLMKARDLWLFMPSVSQPVRLSVAQRMTGEVSYGDLARANFSGDYTPKLLRTEKIDGEDYQVLELTAVDRGVTYARVLYWVRTSNSYPHRAEFYSLSNRLLKTCRYENFKQLAGTVRPTRLVMEDALKKGEVSTLEYEAMKLRDLPDYTFTKEYLKKLQ
ncbi:MAG TPA: outer membrane lipoprotein-sorting protein [Rhodocyclaceae bacterium]|nr:outer membrane lipoprotein-sorting protein [Rhodocyclaceae bacterium]